MYAILVDVTGEEEGASEGIGEISNAKRDATALTVVEVSLESMQDDLVKAPRYLTCVPEVVGRDKSHAAVWRDPGVGADVGCEAAGGGCYRRWGGAGEFFGAGFAGPGDPVPV